MNHSKKDVAMVLLFLVTFGGFIAAIGYTWYMGPDVYHIEQCISDVRVVKVVPKEPDEASHYCFQETTDDSGYHYDAMEGGYRYQHRVRTSRYGCRRSKFACSRF